MIDNLLIKPTGPSCNLACDYCFYLEKESLYPGKNRMELSTAERMVYQLLEPGGPVTFSWQGGEPTLMGLDFFRKAVEFQKKHGHSGQRITNTIQTNGLLLDEDWAKFFQKYNFLVGLSLDGPGDLHDAYRKSPGGKGSFAEVMQAAGLLEKHKVPFNVLTVLNRRTVKQPLRITNFFLQNDLNYIQFIPAIETVEADVGGEISPFSPRPVEVGKFLDKVFQKWASSFPPRFSVRYFDSILNTCLGYEPGMCRIDANCGSYLVVEHNGDVYPCDFFVEKDLKLGNLNQTSLKEVAGGEEFNRFAEEKFEFSEECRDCDYLNYCYGGCQRYRSLPGGPKKRTYLCEAYKYFLSRNLEEIERIAQKVKDRNNGPLRCLN